MIVPTEGSQGALVALNAAHHNLAGQEVVDLSEFYAGVPVGIWWPKEDLEKGYLPKLPNQGVSKGFE